MVGRGQRGGERPTIEGDDFFTKRKASRKKSTYKSPQSEDSNWNKQPGSEKPNQGTCMKTIVKQKILPERGEENFVGVEEPEEWAKNLVSFVQRFRRGGGEERGQNRILRGDGIFPVLSVREEQGKE